MPWRREEGTTEVVQGSGDTVGTARRSIGGDRNFKQSACEVSPIGEGVRIGWS